ncbi:MAG: UDP-N-acetylmuramoyl-tripeptide--D-alanyl-D-alanine ligase [Bacilli bacterium]|nr:UDP-N-acetylmuramoyl-tripeptide--D-alanyl-D-alanine ligase [Bacilli bacterium]MDD4808532.1 UDP-N-acetylmuramoyl-tripeptide--D-alanyl-D-alanine ligase [Bacilli bacterium]
MLYYFYLSLVPVIIYFIIKLKKALHMLQQNWYDDDYRYLKWIINNPYKVFLEVDMLYIIIITTIFVPVETGMMIFGVFYLACIIMSIKYKQKEQVKKPLVITQRVKRLMVTCGILYLIPIILITLIFNPSMLGYYYLIIGTITYFTYFVVMAANVFNRPVEKYVFNHFRKEAIKKISSMSHLEVIGITGSYGKTSSKNILNDILSVKYDVLPTPKNYNTTYGLILSINNYLDKFNEIFIAEMGAFKMGEIKELCDLVKPKYGILTSIGEAHLDSFGSIENIQKGKFELIESLPEDGIAVLNKDDKLQVNYPIQNKCKKVWVGIDNKEADVYATNIAMSYKGMTFDCIFKGDTNKYHFTTKLLGRANIYNLLAGIALGKELGIKVDQLIIGVRKVKATEHRLELKKYGNINIIDDAYNSNPIGSKMALDVLNLMPGKKIIVTPGMIELGDKQYELNLEFGKYMADICDEVILVGETQTKPIFDGLMIKKYPPKRVHVINDVKVAFDLMQDLKDKETYVLLENDLPDIFNEK